VLELIEHLEPRLPTLGGGAKEIQEGSAARMVERTSTASARSRTIAAKALAPRSDGSSCSDYERPALRKSFAAFPADSKVA
jgi:hypothetical protein